MLTDFTMAGVKPGSRAPRYCSPIQQRQSTRVGGAYSVPVPQVSSGYPSSHGSLMIILQVAPLLDFTQGN